jgi:hypothetical protein
MDVSQRGDDFTAPDFQFVALPELSGGGTKYENGLEGYYQSLSKPKKDYLQELFYKQMKAMGGQRQLYEAVMNDPNRPLRERSTAAGSSNQPLRNVLTATLEHLRKERPPRQRYRGYLAGSAAQP